MNSDIITNHLHIDITGTSDLNIYKYSIGEYLYYNVYEHFTEVQFWIFSVSLLLLHNCIKFEKTMTKYFLMHFLFNMYVSVSTLRDTVNIFNHPYEIESVSNHMSLLVVLFHIYHIVFYYNTIKLDEIIHHIWIVFILMPITWLYYCNLANSSLFFMTGFPGGMTYLLLVMKDMDVISSLTEKRVSKYLNMWIRIPGAIVVGYIIYINAVVAETNGSYISLLFCAAGSIWNGIYFGNTIIGSYAVSKFIDEEKNRLKKKC